MKKIIFTVAAVIAVVGSSFAQKATLDNPWSLEGGINYSGTGGIDWTAPTIRARYFVNENIAVRVQLGLGDGLGTAMSESKTFLGANAGEEGTLEIKRMAWNAQVGGEYHLAGTDRLSPYFALGLNFGGGKSTATTENSDGTAFVTGLSTERTGGFSMFGVGLGAGLDVYVIENLYLGVELGLNFDTYNYKDTESTVTMVAGGTTVSTTTTTPGRKETYLSTGAMNAAFRLGWRF